MCIAMFPETPEEKLSRISKQNRKASLEKARREALSQEERDAEDLKKEQERKERDEDYRRRYAHANDR
ncbi:MAG: hypothetical protein Q8N55_03645 [bacterium]|nr:hypothetical protein [bacterium]